MTWWRRLWHGKELEEELDKELRFHLDQHAADLIAGGERGGEARRQANLALGGLEQVKESCRDTRGTRRLNDLLQDLRYALRTLRRRPGFAAVGLLTIGLGSGATTVMFTIINSVLLKPLAYPESNRLVSLHEETDKQGEWQPSYPNFLDCKRASRSLMMAAWRNGSAIVSEPGEAEYVTGRQISADLFSVLDIPLLRGREFLPDEDRPGGTPVAIISARLWQTRYSGGPGAIGARLIFDGRAYTVIGIAPAGFRLLSEAADVFTPLGQNTSPPMKNREMHPGIRVIARMRPGVSLAQAQAELALIAQHLAQQYPKSNAGRSISAELLRQEIVGDIRPMLWLLLGAVSLVLLIACLNVASLLLARAISRDRELAMRVALGAGRGRLVRQCLTESAVLALGGGTLGVAFAAVATRRFLVFWPGGLPRADEVHVDWRVLVFALAASLLSGILFGLAPALRAPARELEQALRAGGRTAGGGSRRLHAGFVISEIAIAAVLLVSAGMLGRTLLRVLSLDPGINPRNVLVAEVALSSESLASPARTRMAWQELLDRVHQVPGVDSVAMADVIPMAGDTEQIGYWTTAAAPPTNQMTMSLLNLVTPGYLQVMGIPLLQGRFFNEQDRVGNELVVVVDEIMAKRAFGNRGAIGKRLSLQVLGPARVVGVVRHVRHWGLDADDQAKVREQVYVSFAQLPDPYVRLISRTPMVVRTTVAPSNVVEAVRRQVRGATRDQVMFEIRTMEQIVTATLARQRFLLLLFGTFAALALSLACIGIYGVLAYLTGQRVPEFGVRMALGAGTADVLRLVMRQSVRMILIGAGLGVGASLVAGSVLERLVTGIRPTDPWTFVVTIGILVSAALSASFLPARRASRVDPMSALRQE